ncbi:helix-turn-helix domain-containing protein [Halovivax sp.]|uniref:helix-turn-helix domain-containing protein n=1 Tax=Halovivax sp. TaxID=1935978 RepID=UPI0025BF9151|nr:helix-turn-helix domain-containing protein [Halovivax sp.]
MTTVVTFEVSAADTALGDLLASAPSAVCEVEQVIASRGHGIWFAGAERDRIERALDEDTSVASYGRLSSLDDRWLYDVTFAEDALDVFDLVAAAGGAVLSATAEDGAWSLEIRFADREDASGLYDRFAELDADATLVRLSTVAEGAHAEYGLTEKQYEALLAALEHGYFTIPRETSMEELADVLDVSHQALSERLRRAYRALVLTELDGTAAPGTPTIDQAV